MWKLCLIFMFFPHLFQGDCSCAPRCRSTARSGSLSNSTTPTKTPLRSLSTSTTTWTTSSPPTASRSPTRVSVLFIRFLVQILATAVPSRIIYVHTHMELIGGVGGEAKSSSSHSGSWRLSGNNTHVHKQNVDSVHTVLAAFLWVYHDMSSIVSVWSWAEVTFHQPSNPTMKNKLLFTLPALRRECSQLHKTLCQGLTLLGEFMWNTLGCSGMCCKYL